MKQASGKAAHDIKKRRVWVADSFAGLPKAGCAQDHGWDLSSDIFPFLSVSQEEVKELFSRYDLLDDRVKFLKGWFKDTLTHRAHQEAGAAAARR